jgi:Flp pilus assembly protein TadD
MTEHDAAINTRAAHLTLVDGPGKGGSIQVPVGSTIVIGRGDGADERLGGDDAISRRHAKLEHLRLGQLTVTDLGSTNGVYLEGSRISQPTRIRPGERIELGQTALLLEPSAPEPTRTIERVASKSTHVRAPAYDQQIGMGHELLRRGRAEAAEDVFARATGVAPERPDAHLGRGLALMELGRLDEASRALGDAVRRDERLTDAWHQLGVISERQGDRETALAYYRHALLLDDGHRGARQGVEALGPRPDRAQASGRAPMSPAAPAMADKAPGAARAPQQPATLAAAADAAAKGPAPTTWDHGSLLTSGRRAMRSFGRRWLAVVALLAVAVATGPLLSALRDAEFTGGNRGVLDELYDRRATLLIALLVLVGLMVALIVLGSIFTQYRVYERRVDFHSGILSRRKSSLWLYDVTDVDSERSPLMLLTNTAALALRSEAGKVQDGPGRLSRRRGQPAPTVDRIIGIGTAREMEELWRTLRGAALRERRAMKNQWV